MARRATLKDVAERAKVSTATVSYVLNDKKSISEQTKTRVSVSYTHLTLPTKRIV